MNRRVVARSFVFAALCVVALAACGGSSPHLAASTTAAGAPASTDQQAALSAYTDCLRQNGVDPSTLDGIGSRPAGTRGPNGSRAANGSRPNDFPNGSFGSRGTLDPALQQARTACQNLLPQGGQGGGNNSPANAAAFSAYLSCLADNGVTVPTTTTVPGATTGTGPNGPRGFGGLGGLDRTQPAFAAADAKCRVLLPEGFGGPTTSATSTTR